MGTFIKRAEAKTKQRRADVEETVRGMIADIADRRDAAVRDYAETLDSWTSEFRVSPDQIKKVGSRLSETFKEDFAVCHRQVKEFAKRQLDSLNEIEVEIAAGVTLGHKHIPVRYVGCYIPGGKYPLISAAIMSIGTARVAGVDSIVSCAPPRDEDGIFGPTLYALDAAGADEIYCLGGVQALCSMAFGCVGMAPVDMITGPGNAYVSEAKRQLFGEVGIDLLAGPTEICVIADDSADPSLVATDLLGQAEHGPDSPAWLVTTSEVFGHSVLAEIERQLETLPTKDVAAVSWRDYGEIVVVADDDEAIAVSDAYAPEHLEIMTRRDDYYLAKLRNYGSLFVGEETTVAYGDKGIGTNHTLPTANAARYTGGLWVGKFLKTVTYQRMTRAASRDFAPVASRQCEAESLLAHKITADVRSARFASG
ncbi:MAG: histidinol dehydrogenase [Alphaproteobacteria bacterium]